MRIERWEPARGDPLRPYVQAVFSARGRAAYRRETILPKGNVDILFNLGDPLHVAGSRVGELRVGGAAAAIAGLQTRPFVSSPTGTLDLVGISLRAETCAAVLHLPLRELTDRTVEGALVLPQLTGLLARLGPADSFADRRALLLDWLVGRLRPGPGLDAVRRGCALLRRDPGEEAVGRAAAELGITPRHLRRLFGEHVGVSPAEYVRLTRFVAALHAARRPGTSLTAVAHAARYYDQPHFCREFRALADMTPREYRLLADGPVVGHIFSV